jgi:hypothetical protein
MQGEGKAGRSAWFSGFFSGVITQGLSATFSGTIAHDSSGFFSESITHDLPDSPTIAAIFPSTPIDQGNGPWAAYFVNSNLLLCMKYLCRSNIFFRFIKQIAFAGLVLH